MTEQVISLSEAIKNAINSKLVELHTATIGKISQYYSNDQTADVQPLVKRVFFNGDDPVSLPLLPKVPVQPIRTKDAYIHLPIKAGDYVLVIFCERSIDKVLLSGNEVDPEDLRRHSLSDAIAIPYNPIQSDKISVDDTDAISIVNGSTKLIIKDDGKFKFENNSQELIDLVDQLIDAILSATTNTFFGAQPLVPPSLFTEVKTKLATLKG